MGAGSRTKVLLLSFFCLAFLSALTASAQSGTTGTLNGVVRDTTGAVLPGVIITLRNVDTGLNRSTATDDAARWTVPALPVGNYEITYELTGFKKLVHSGVRSKRPCLEPPMPVSKYPAAVKPSTLHRMRFWSPPIPHQLSARSMLRSFYRSQRRHEVSLTSFRPKPESAQISPRC